MVDRNVWRVLDANANRAAEGLRALEDLARLVHEDVRSSLMLKSLRHRLGLAVQGLDRKQRLGARSTERDAGIGNSSTSELSRWSAGEVLVAECERVGQSLRVLEEFSKLVDPAASEQFKQLRYQAYDDLAKIELAWTQHAWLQSETLCLLIDCELPLSEFADYLRRLGGAGLTCVQVRDKKRSDRDLMNYASAAVQVMDKYSGHVIVNDRLDIAMASGAAGVHLGQEDMSMVDARKTCGERLCIGISTHSIQQAREAVEMGADYIGCGPSFPSQTKSFDHFPGMAFLAEIAKEISIPCMAIGGVDLDNLQRVVDVGFRCIAISAAVHRAPDPELAVQQFRQRFLTHLADRHDT